MPYKVMRVVDVETYGGRDDDGPSTNEHFEEGLNRLENEGYALKSVLHGEGGPSQTRLIFHTSKRAWNL